MNNSQNIYPSQMEQILKDKGFVYSSEKGFRTYSIPGVPFSFHTHLAVDGFQYPKDRDIFNRLIENAVNRSNKYLK